MGLLTFGLNVTLDGCIDHRVGLADDETHELFTALMDSAGAMLWGRTTYELMEEFWPDVAAGRVEVPPALLDWASKLEAKPKYVLSSTRSDYGWANTHHLPVDRDGGLEAAVRGLKGSRPDGVLLGSASLATALQGLGLIDEYRFLIHPVIAGQGPRLFDGAAPTAPLELVSSRRLGNGCLDVHYRRPA
ncbi:MAG: dihydrofolate reductase family protein [Arthrobacter sp.]|jgi:dihydrofolate reductase|nr:dihydrofolate reductase family protein [Arthrobacter sp.]